MSKTVQIVPAECDPTTLERVSEFNGPGFVFEEKKDGVRAVLQIHSSVVLTGRSFTKDGQLRETQDKHHSIRDYPFHPILRGHVLDGELMADGTFWVFDLPEMDAPLSERRRSLVVLSEFFPPWMQILPQSTDADQLLAAAERGLIEGIVAKRQSDKYGFGWFKAKRVETYDVKVTSMNGNGSASVSVDCEQSGNIMGVPDDVQVGDIIEVVCFKRFASGKFRSGRFVRSRPDKM